MIDKKPVEIIRAIRNTRAKGVALVIGGVYNVEDEDGTLLVKLGKAEIATKQELEAFSKMKPRASKA